MRKEIIVFIIAMVVVIAFPALAAAEGPEGQRGERTTVGPRSAPSPDGWMPCPRCQNNADREAEREEYEVEGHDFDPQDLNGVWGFDGVNAGGNFDVRFGRDSRHRPAHPTGSSVDCDFHVGGITPKPGGIDNTYLLTASEVGERM